jgi:hypothetical protein
VERKILIQLFYVSVVCLLFTITVLGQSEKTLKYNENLAKKEAWPQISFHYKSQPLASVLSDLSEKYKLNFSYINESIPLGRKITAYAKNKPLSDGLYSLLLNTGIKHYFIAGQIVLVKEELLDSLGWERLPDYKKSKDSVRVYGIVKGVSKKDFQWRKVADLFAAEGLGTFGYTRKTDIDSTHKDTLKTDTVLSRSGVTTAAKKAAADTKISTDKHKIFLNIYCTPGVTSWKLNTTTTLSELKNRNEYKGSGGFSFGVVLEYYFTERFFARTGLDYLTIAKNGIHTDYFVHFFKRDRIYMQRRNYADRYTYITVPLSAGYTLKKGKISFRIYSGFMPAVYMGSKGATYYNIYENQYYFIVREAPFYTQDNKEIITEKISYRRVNLMYYLAAELSCSIHKKLQITIAPSYRGGMFSIYSSDAPLKEKFSFLGIQAGIRYSL